MIEKYGQFSLAWVCLISKFFWASVLTFAFFSPASCRKAGFVQTPSSLNIVGAYRVPEEGIDYAFFKLNESPEVLESSQWFYALDDGNGDIVPSSAKWEPLDFSKGVHEHKLVDCGSGVRCGSFSFPSAPNIRRVSFRMLYHPEGTADLTASATFKDFGDGPSSLIYGVFDSTNSRVQVRVEDNFGIPSKEDIKNYGMTRKYRVRSPQSATVPSTVMAALRAERSSNYHFPADFCPLSSSADNSQIMKGSGEWLGGVFSSDDGTNGVCVTVDFLSKSDQVLTQHGAFARRNPRFQSGSYNYNTPLRQATKIPVVLAYCSDAIGAARARDEEFLDYQKKILGQDSVGEDLCFKVGSDAQFRSALAALLTSKLSQAKSAATSSADFIFTVVLHQNLSEEFRSFHAIVAEELTALTNTEANLVSPRLVGSFIYDSKSDYRPSTTQEKSMIWCPSEKPKDPSSSSTSTVEANCLVSDPRQIGSAFLNFLIPMGPFPTLPTYRRYVDKYGDRGLVKKPDIGFQSVLKDGSSFTETAKNLQVTYFDNERLIVDPSDRVHVCWGDPGAALLKNIRLRGSTFASTAPGLDIQEAQSLWSIGQGVGDFRIGVVWELPFVGKITYRSPLNGTVFSFVPFRMDFAGYQILGDLKWVSETLDFGKLLQVCKQYCDHPWFDEAGVYQVSSNYSDEVYNGCVSPKYPLFTGTGLNVQ
jgi:hypothetical protein